jgi:hypothetical protein
LRKRYFRRWWVLFGHSRHSCSFFILAPALAGLPPEAIHLTNTKELLHFVRNGPHGVMHPFPFLRQQLRLAMMGGK